MDSLVERLPGAAGDTPSDNTADAMAPTTAAALLSRYGSPLFVILESTLRARYRLYAKAFRCGPDGRTAIAYSYKTNHLPAACAILRQEGAWAEVTSGAEYTLARSVGCPAAKIIFNGPAKRLSEIEAALAAGALVVADSLGEIETLADFAGALDSGRTFRVGLRIGLEPAGSPWSRFGLDAATGEAMEAIRRIATHPRIHLEMLHNHGGEDRHDPASFAATAERLCGLVEAAQSLGLRPERIDLGGGFTADVPPQDYADAIFPVLDRAEGRLGRRISLAIEPGRAIADPAGLMLATVSSVKEGAGRRPTIFLDAGINLMPPSFRAKARTLRIVSPETTGAPTRPTDVFGPLCMPEDLVAEGALLPPLAPGAIVAVDKAGAYTLSRATQFIDPRPAVVLWGPDGPVLVRRRERWRDVFALDSIPDRLQGGRSGF